MTDSAAKVSPPLAVAFAAIGFFAVVIAGFGLTALYSGTDVVAEGHSQLPGILATALATTGLCLALWPGVRRTRPSYGAALTATVAALVGFLVGLGLGALIEGTGPAAAAALMGAFAVSWFALVVGLAAFVAGWAGVAMVRTEARAPRWPWEKHEED